MPLLLSLSSSASPAAGIVRWLEPEGSGPAVVAPTGGFRNICGKTPTFQETFINDGGIDVYRVIGTLKRSRFTGFAVDDHMPYRADDHPLDVAEGLAPQDT